MLFNGHHLTQDVRPVLYTPGSWSSPLPCDTKPSVKFMLRSGHPAMGDIPQLYLSPGISTRGRKEREAGRAEGGAERRCGLSQGPGLLRVELWSGNDPAELFPAKARGQVDRAALPAAECRLPGKGAVALAKVAFSERQFCRGLTAECLLLPAPPAAGGRSPSLSQGDCAEGLSAVPTSTPRTNKDTQSWENETSGFINHPLTFKKRVNCFKNLAIY